MMYRGLTAEQLASLQKEGAIVKALIEVVHDGIEWRYCTGTVGAELDGELYSTRPLRISAATSGKIDGIHMTVELCNRDDALSSDLKVDGLTGAMATATLITDGGEAITIMRGDVTRCVIADDLKIEVGPLNRGWKESGLIKCSRMCPYVYNGPLCGAGHADPDCRRTLVDCTDKGNQLRFGGFIWALDAGESIMVEDQPVRVEPSGASGSGPGGDNECHSGWFVTEIAADGSTRQVEIRCDVEGIDNGRGDHTDGYFTDPWTFHIDSYPEEEES